MFCFAIQYLFVTLQIQNTITRKIWNIKRLALKVFGL